MKHETFPQPDQNRDFHWAEEDVRLEFIWDEHLNSSALLDYLEAYRDGSDDAPSVFIIGAGRRYAEQGGIQDYHAAVEAIAELVSPIAGAKVSNGIALTPEDGPGNLLLFAPIEEPYNDFPDASSSFREINVGLKKLSDRRMIDVLWAFTDMTARRKEVFQSDGWNPRWEVIHQRSDVLLGLRCNAMSVKTRTYPHTRTCCGIWDGPNGIQIAFLIFGLGLLPFTVVIDTLWPILSEDKRRIVRACCAFASVISLQYLADRTHIFEQVQRLSLRLPNLYGMLAVAFVIGIVTVRRSVQAPNASSGEKESNLLFLPRDQSDEMKGWMQLLIIIYHYNMAWTFDRYWEIIRLAVASYLFLTGFGHTIYFLQKEDYSLRRVVAVLIRTNLLPCTLAYVMRTRWVLYYYMPLSTFWFLVVYATMAVARSWNKNRALLLVKIFASAALVRAFVKTPDLAEAVVRVFTITCKTDFNGHEFFHHRVKIDQYIVYVGMLVGIFYIWCKKTLANNDHQSRFAKVFNRCWIPLQALAIVAALVGFAGFWGYIHYNVKSQGEWTKIQPYITFIPIITYLILRNAHSSLRNWHSVAIAWLGRYSGEMYVMQDHLWLAGDQEAVLRTGLFHGNETVPGDRWRDLLLLTPFYLIACSIVGDSTATITEWFVRETKGSKTVSHGPVGPDSDVQMSLLADTESVESAIEEKSMGKAAPRWRRPSIFLWPQRVSGRFLLLLGLMWLLNVVSFSS